MTLRSRLEKQASGTTYELEVPVSHQLRTANGVGYVLDPSISTVSSFLLLILIIVQIFTPFRFV